MNKKSHLYYSLFDKGVPRYVRIPEEENTPEWQKKLGTEGVTHPMEILEFAGPTPQEPISRPILREHSPVPTWELYQVESPDAIKKLISLWEIAIFTGLEPEDYRKEPSVASADVARARALLEDCNERSARRDHNAKCFPINTIERGKAAIRMVEVRVDFARTAVMSHPYTEGRTLQKRKENLLSMQSHLANEVALMDQHFPGWNEDQSSAPELERAR